MVTRGETALTLADLSNRFLLSLSLEARPEYQVGVNRFIQWFGADRKAFDLRPADVERFASMAPGNIAASGRWFEPVHAFLAYAHRQGATTSNLSSHLRLRKTAGESRLGMTDTSGRVLMTAEGLAALEQEVEHLKNQRPMIAESLRLAMADKDFRENSPLDAAREQQAHVETRIRELEQMLKVASVVDSTASPTGVTRVGCRVAVRDLDSGNERSFILVSPTEVNPGEGKISIVSPVGRALLDRSTGEEVEIAVPRGRLRLRIESIDG